MNPANKWWTFIFLLAALVFFVYAAFRNGIGKTKTDFVALGLACWVLIQTWNAAAACW